MTKNSDSKENPRKRRPLMYIGVGVGVAIVLLAIMFVVDQQSETGFVQPKRQVDLDSIAIPGNPTAEELAKATAGLDQDAMAALRGGAWIQVANAEGHLAQEYTAERIDPLPGQWIDMVNPSAMIYPASGRVVTMTAERGRAHVPARAMESGMLEGNVVIRIYEPSAAGVRADPDSTAPSMTIYADDAEFDNVQGSITSANAIRVETETILFRGEGLSIQLAEESARIERLIVERATAPIEIRSKRTVETHALLPSDEWFCVVQDEPVSVEPSWYRLVLQDNVRIERFLDDSGKKSTVLGDRLVATFVLGEGGPGATFAGAGGDVPMSTRAFIAAAIMGGGVPEDVDPTDGQTVVYIHYTGRLVMTPDETARVRLSLSGTDDGEVIVEGTEGRGIQLHDEVNNADVDCARLRYRAAKDMVELIGDDSNPFSMRSPTMTLTGDRFWLARASGVGGVVGAGRMVLRKGATALEAALLGFPEALQHALAAASGESRAVMEAVVRRFAQDEAPGADQEEGPDLVITWTEGIDLDFEDGDGDGQLTQARFRGDVAVASEAFTMSSETLAIDFSDDPKRPDTIERIVAEGGARVIRLGEAGQLEAETIDLTLDEGPDGKTVPSVMLARGGVEASDPLQRMWTEELEIHFEPIDPTKGNAPKRGFAGGVTGVETGEVRITTVAARKRVQVRMNDGARIFADRLDGNPATGTLDLAGEDVAILRENVFVDQMHDLKIDDNSKTVRGTGPGRFRYYEAAIVPETVERIDRPKLPDAVSMRATWSESLAYDEAANDGGGRLDLGGRVRVRTEPVPEETGRLDAERVRLDFKAGAAKDGELAKREVEKLTADGDAILESRAWKTSERAGDPRLFRITGGHVEYEPETREALVEGAGSLLVHDPTPDEDVEGVPSGPIGLFGVDGTSRFTWAKRMEMRRTIADRFLIVMEEEVEVLHAGLKEEDTFSLTGDRLEVTVDRAREDAKDADPTGVDLGGPARLLRVRGIGRVFVRSPDQDVECEEFDYNVETQIAMLRAREGRVVTIQPRNAATPIRAELVQWDLATGRMRILKGEGAVSP